MDWREKYHDVAHQMAACAPRSGALLAGFSACVDHVYHLGDRQLRALVEHSQLSGVPGRTATSLLERIGSGGDGEIFVDWPDGAAWLAKVLAADHRAQVGGTGPQAIWALEVAGGVGIVSLADRSVEQLAVMPPGALIAEPDGLRRASEITPAGHGKPPHVICEISAGSSVRGVTLPRADRVIVRFHRDGIERDEQFAALDANVLAHCSAGLISGLTAVPPAEMNSTLAWLRDIASAWRGAGVNLVHFESAEYEHPDLAMAVLRALTGSATSIGLSLSELHQLCPGQTDVIAAMRDLAELLVVDRIQVHAARWAASVHRGDPEAEERALTAGALLASLRAAHGTPRGFGPIDDRFLVGDALPPITGVRKGWTATAVPTPYVHRPAGTIGLGDTFVAGSLLALMTSDGVSGGPSPRAALGRGGEPTVRGPQDQEAQQTS